MSNDSILPPSTLAAAPTLSLPLFLLRVPPPPPWAAAPAPAPSRILLQPPSVPAPASDLFRSPPWPPSVRALPLSLPPSLLHIPQRLRTPQRLYMPPPPPLSAARLRQTRPVPPPCSLWRAAPTTQTRSAPIAGDARPSGPDAPFWSPSEGPCSSSFARRPSGSAWCSGHTVSGPDSARAPSGLVRTNTN